jgi:hypothetical protein
VSDINTVLHVDDSEKKFTLNRVQDVEPILDINKELQTLDQKSDWGRHVATIPSVFIEKWLNEEWERGNIHLKPFTPEFDILIEAKLQDPDWKFLRTDKSTSVLGWNNGWSAGLCT